MIKAETRASSQIDEYGLLDRTLMSTAHSNGDYVIAMAVRAEVSMGGRLERLINVHASQTVEP